MQDSLFASFTSADLEGMIQSFSSEEDAETRQQMFTDIGQYLRDEAAAVFIALANEPYAVSDKVGEWDIITAYVWNFESATVAE